MVCKHTYISSHRPSGERPIHLPDGVVTFLDLTTLGLLLSRDTGRELSTSHPAIISLMDTLVTATKSDVEAHFNTHGTGDITEIKLMNGFGFIEYKDAMDARDVVPGKHSSSSRQNYK